MIHREPETGHLEAPLREPADARERVGEGRHATRAKGCAPLPVAARCSRGCCVADHRGTDTLATRAASDGLSQL